MDTQNQGGLFQALLSRQVGQGQAPAQPSQAQGLWSVPAQPPQPPGGQPPGGQPPPPQPPPVPPPQSGNPTVLPNPHATVPPQAQRWATAQEMSAGYQNGWQPNPMLIRAMNGHK